MCINQRQVDQPSTTRRKRMTAIGQYDVLVIDDVPAFLQEIKGILTGAGMRVTTCLSPIAAIKDVRRKNYDLVITALVIREMGGFDIIRAIRSSGSSVPIMMITGYGSEQAAIEATRLGATDYLDKPVNPEELVARVNRILDPVHSLLASRAPSANELLTQDAAMKSMLETVQVLAGTHSRVLIMGETGTGKQLVARALHTSSSRRNEPFIDVNCAAIPDALLESELFGHEKGAFTGATERRIGRFEEAGRGTIFLDEIGEMGYALQSKLLKVLQDGRFNRVGGSQQLVSNARVVAATNRDLEKEVAQGRFRSDLYYRLQVMTLQLPPLRRRPGDIPLLAEHFLSRYSVDGDPTRTFAPETLQLMMRYPWPGNVRELENLVERIAVLYRSSPIQTDALPERILQGALPVSSSPLAPQTVGIYHEAKQQFEVAYLQSTLARTHGNMAEAARLAGLDRSQFFRMVKRHRLDPRAVTSGSLAKA